MKIQKFSEKTSNILDGHEFYDLMQYYRHTPITDQAETTSCFNDVKNFINENFIVKDVEEVKKWLVEEEAKRYNL